ncbi:GNAT family N-acetyltransferase [Pseudonocardia sp. CA-107938]|uniref:GNAT family N-acetyltransferase n=1 Tax=Pseudonocardia sp. CA-107938 TaxID=3240021 RepID=UPI003D94532E
MRPFAAADLDDLAALHGDPQVMRFIDAPVPRAVVERETLPGILRSYAQLPAGQGVFAAVADDGTFVGQGSLGPVTSRGLVADGLELGYRIVRARWGRGFATQIARMLVRRAFVDLGATRVVATTMAVNIGSRRVLERSGLRWVRTFHLDWPDPLPGSEHGEVEYALSRRRDPMAGA